MPPVAKYILLGIAVLLIAGKRIFEKKPFVVKYNNIIRLLVFVPLIIILAFEFIHTKNWLFIVILILGLAALTVVFYEMFRSDRDKEKPNPPES